jgi:rod shape-determining protein MreD
MIMRPGQQLLLPANPLFIWSTLVVALLFNMLQNMGLWGRAAWTPDLLALVLVFWTVHQPLRVGVGVAFVFGLLVDVHQSSVLGQHALAYTVLSFCHHHPPPAALVQCARRRCRCCRCWSLPMRWSWRFA